MENFIGNLLFQNIQFNVCSNCLSNYYIKLYKYMECNDKIYQVKTLLYISNSIIINNYYKLTMFL